MVKNLLLPYLMLLACFSSCQTSATQENNQDTAAATLLWTGEIAADGCGFEVMIDGKKYLPANEDAIDAVYKNQDSTQVQLEFVRLPEPIDRRCGMLPQPRVMNAIQIVSVTPL